MNKKGKNVGIKPGGSKNPNNRGGRGNGGPGGDPQSGVGIKGNRNSPIRVSDTHSPPSPKPKNGNGR